MTCSRNWFALGDNMVPIRVALIDCDAPYALSGDETVTMTFVGPSGQTFTRPGILQLPSTVYYMALSADFTEAGTWTVYPSLVLDDGGTRRSVCGASFTVRA